MLDKINALIDEVTSFETKSKDELEAFRIKFLSKKGILNDLFAEFKLVPNHEKKDVGQAINTLKNKAQNKINVLKENLDSGTNQATYGDLTRPGESLELGARHPISIVKNQIIDIPRIGFNVSEGPEVEDDWHNFTALNLPEYHPARDMQDTFFIQTNPDILLRTHTSSVQVRYMEENKPPIRTISRRVEYTEMRLFLQDHITSSIRLRGLYIDKGVSFADLKQTLEYFTTELFGKSKIRLRPSYFPFTEPSAEVDVYWGLETETDYKMTKGTGWLEIMGCGMVDPNVLENCGIDSSEYSGFAFGMGIDRIALLLHQINDIRLLSENDVRFLEQFKSTL